MSSAFAHGVGLSGREPSPSNRRRPALLHLFLLQVPYSALDVLKANPCDPVERPKPRPSAPSGLSAPQMQQLLHVIPDTLKGRRDLAIVLTLVLTGRRRSEVINLTAGDVSYDETLLCFIDISARAVVRGRRELPQPRFGRDTFDLLVMSARTSPKCILPSRSGRRAQGLPAFPAPPSTAASGAISRLAGLPPSGVHVLRHTAAKLRRDVGESVESVSQFLDHSSLAVTTTYLRRLEGERDTAWQGVANILGVG